jgi:hypothetical protein
LFFRQQAFHRRQQLTLRGAIIDATEDHIPPPFPAPVAVFPITKIQEFSPPEEKDLSDDISAFIYDFN